MLKQIVVTLFLVGCVVALPPRLRHKYEQQLTTSNFRGNGRILGGRNATIEEHPYQIALFYRDFHLCGGAILNANTILTAAQCADGRIQSYFTVRAGSTSMSSGGQFIIVTEYFEHELYHEFELSHDVAIMKLSSNLVFSASVRAIMLPPLNLVVPHDSIATVSGWGALIIRGGVYPDNLQTVQVPVVDNRQCQLIFKDEDIRVDHICAGDSIHNALPGDTGGPLTYQGFVIGIVSWGFGFDFETPTIFTRVSEVLPFIRRHM